MGIIYFLEVSVKQHDHHIPEDQIHLGENLSPANDRLHFSQSRGRAVTQAVSRWLPTVAARVHVLAEHEGFVVDKAALGQVSSE
jgi:hypothetical protein